MQMQSNTQIKANADDRDLHDDRKPLQTNVVYDIPLHAMESRREMCRHLAVGGCHTYFQTNKRQIVIETLDTNSRYFAKNHLFRIIVFGSKQYLKNHHAAL